MKRYYFFNGKIGDFLEVSANDIGFLRGYGVFEVLRTYSSKPFLLDKHLERLENSAQILGLDYPPRKDISDGIQRLIFRFPNTEVSLKIVLTGGQMLGDFSFDPHSPTFLIIAEKFVGLDDRVYRKGISLFPVEHQRVFPRAKTLNYIFPIKMKRDINEKGFFDLLYTLNDKILESSTSNFFIVKGNTLITPIDDLLLGITRGFVIDIAKDCFDVEERDVTFKELEMADEAFITATNKEIVPVTKIGDLVIGSGLVGDITKKLMTLFKDRVNQLVS